MYNPEIPHKTKISKINVIVRKRPANHREYNQKDIDIINTIDKNTIIVKELKNKVDLTKYIEEHRFIFDRVYGDDSTNQLIYTEMVKPMIEAAFHKTKITCFAYGQTGSGKTYTMMGTNNLNNGQNVPGLYLLSCIDVFKYLKKKEYNFLEIWVSFYEIYCNKLFDLLNNKNVLQAREDGKGNICIAGLIEKNAKTINELMSLIDFGLNSRTVGITGANLDSSRSHAILQIALKNNFNGENYSKISFIDLAGSERAVDTIDTNKQNKIDGAEINKSLLALKECIRAMDMEKRHKPFRGSKLTLVLRDSFIGNCLTLMIANISPCLSCSEHTLNTLRYADRVKELRKPKHEKENENNENFYGKNNNVKKEKDLLADLLTMNKINEQNVKYKVEIKKTGNNQPNNLIVDHNYNYLKIKSNKNNNNFIDLNKDIQKPDKNVLKIDDIIRNEKIPSNINGFRKKNRNSSETKKNNIILNNLINNYLNNDEPKKNNEINIIDNKENGNNKYDLRNSDNSKYVNNIRKIDYARNNNNNEDVNVDEYISQYNNIEIKNDEEYKQLFSKHEELINNILKEEDVFICDHKSHIDNMVESIKEEMKFLHEVDKPGSDIEEYTNNLDKLLLNEIKEITKLRGRLNKFRIMLKDEESLANIFDDEVVLSAEDDKKGSEDSLENEDLLNEGIPNKPKFKFEKK